MSKSLCIVTSYTDDISSYAFYAEQSMRIYARAIGADFYRFDKSLEGRPPYWLKIRALQEKMRSGYDWLFWIDADTIIARFDISILREVDLDKDLHLHSHKFSSLNYLIPNTGVMLVKNSAWSRAFFEEAWGLSHFEESMWHDNAAIIHLMGFHSLLTPDQRNPDKPNEDVLSHIGHLSERWNSVPWDCTEKDPIIHHYPGGSKSYRDKMAPRHFAEAATREIERLRSSHDQAERD